MDLQDYLNKAEEYLSNTHDHIKPTDDMEFDQSGNLVFKTKELFGATPPMKPTDWAFTQLCSKLGPTVYGKANGESDRSLPKAYLQAIDSDLRAELLNRHLQKADKSWLVRGYGGNVRAILDSKYPVIENTDLISAVNMIFEESKDGLPDFKVANRSYLDPDTMHLKTLWSRTSENRGGYSLGVFIGNSLIGNGKIRINPIIQRTSCENSIINSGKGIEFVHKGKIQTLKVQILAVLGDLFESNGDMVDKMMLAEEQKLPSILDCIAGLRTRENWSDEFTNTVIAGTENKQSKAGLIHGLTWAAHQDGVKPDDTIKYETMAGDLLYSAADQFQALARLGMKKKEEERLTLF